MTRDDAKAILENLAAISHYAAGGELEYPLFDCYGDFIRWNRTDRMSLCCLGRYRIVGDTKRARVMVNPHQHAGAEAVKPDHHGDLKKRRRFERSRGNPNEVAA